MLRRMLPTLAVLGLGLAMLLWGLGSLQRVIMDERAETRAQVIAQRNVLEEYARRTLEQRLESSLPEAQFNWAREDPLMPTQHLLFIERGQQVFPRPIRYASAGGDEARRLYTALRNGLEVSLEPATPWARRVELIERFRLELLNGDRTAIEASFRELIDHRAHWVLDSRRDIPARLAVLDLLVEYADPNPELLESLLRHGLFTGDQLLVEGLQPALIRRRERFSAEDFQFLAGRVIALSERTQSRADDFQARVAEPVSVPLPPPPGMLLEPALVLGGTWYARPAGPDRVVGVSIEFDELLRQVEAEMHARALLAAQDGLLPPDLSAQVVPLSTLVIGVRSSRFADALEAGERRYRVKTGFVGLSAFLALVIVALALVVQGRRQRFVELKSDFVATVSHELRTPLASIRLMAETLERRTSGVPSARDYPSRIVRAIDDLSFLVENILSFNRLDKGRWKPRPSDVDIEQVVGAVEQEVHMFAPRSVEIHVEGVDGVLLHADRELLKLLLRNLVKNACAYNERDPIVIDIRGGLERGRWVLAVRDNGVGISPLDQRRIFADFYRARGSSSHGSGLGLSIARKVMRAHGGQIAVGHSSPEGSTFLLSFPKSLLRRHHGDANHDSRG